MSELVLENDNLKVTFPGDKSGFSAIWLKGFNPGAAIYTEYNRLDEDLRYKICGGDYHGIYALGQEYWSGSVGWITYKTTVSSRDLYGAADPYDNAPTEVVKVISGDVITLGNDRALNSQELTYYFTPDGLGLVKRVRLNLRKTGPQANMLQSVLFMNYASFTPLSGNFGAGFFAFREKSLGFHDLSAWDADPGLGLSPARLSLYPNLVPGFDSTEWRAAAGSPSVVSGRRLDLSAGDVFYLCRHDAYPAARVHTMRLEVPQINGTLRLYYGLSRNAIDCESEAQVLEITAAGEYIMRDMSGEGDNFLFLRLEQLGGSARVEDAVVNYLQDGVEYSENDGSYLAHTSLRNCARVCSSDPAGLRLVRNLSAPIKIAAGQGVKLSVLSLDRTSIEGGAFRVLFQKLDGSWAATAQMSMLVDYNDLYPAGSWERFNLWGDSAFGTPLPAGVEEIKAVAIEWLTSEPVDWLLDGLVVAAWQENEPGCGAELSLRMGEAGDGLRRQSFALRGTQGVLQRLETDVRGERISVVVVGGPQGYGEYVPLTLQNISAVDEVYQIDEGQVLDTAWGDWSDEGFRLTYDASGISDYLYPVTVKNVSRNEFLTIIFSGDNKIVVDVSRCAYSLADTLRITYARKATVAPAHWSLGQNARGRWCVKWAYDSWTIAHDRESVYLDYRVSSRGDDSPAFVVASSNHDCSRLCREYPGPAVAAPQLGTYCTYVFSDPANETAEGLFIYRPLLNREGDALYDQAQAVQDLADSLYTASRRELISPLPRNYNLSPMLSFGGETAAADPVSYLQRASSCFFAANASNAVLAGGSLNHLYDRDMEAWWEWSPALRDHGVNYLSASRNILRRGYGESMISHNLNRHRYFVEVSVFAYTHIKRHPEQAALDYRGDSAYRRVWYYQAQNGAYSTLTRAWDDFSAAYYEPLLLHGETYYFRYHYILAIPAFWSVVKPASYWGLDGSTVYDLVARRVDYLCRIYDTEGVLISELLYYGYSFDERDFTLYNEWRESVKGLPPAADWPRDSASGYILVDDPEIWEFKRHYIKDLLRDLASLAHSRNKLLGVNAQVQNCIPVKQPQAAVWQGYEQRDGPYGACVDTLDYSCDRYGTNYDELLGEDCCDLLFIWLYHRYSSFGVRAVYDFMERFAAYKERMLVTVGLFPKEDPPAAAEVIHVVQKLLKAGFNVCYAGYPPMLLDDERWSQVWPSLSDYVPLLRYDQEGRLEINPKQVEEVPFLVRF